jgi:hypothetical protein
VRTVTNAKIHRRDIFVALPVRLSRYECAEVGETGRVHGSFDWSMAQVIIDFDKSPLVGL